MSSARNHSLLVCRNHCLVIVNSPRWEGREIGTRREAGSLHAASEINHSGLALG